MEHGSASSTAAAAGGGGGGSGAQATTKNSSRPKRARPKSEKVPKVENTKRFHCNYCERDLSYQIRARCAVCPDYDSCLDCFTVGAALKPHQANHAYRLIEFTVAPLYQTNWTADEEERLLEGLESHGIGNWEDVAKNIKSKNASETEAHYERVYLHSQTAPLPDISRMLPASPPVKNVPEDIDPKALKVMHMHQQEDIAGFMPKRKDFVYEYDNEAEQILGDMEISPDDSRADRDLKLQVLEIYNYKLDERRRRKDFVLQRNLIDFKGYQTHEKKRPKEERELMEKLRVFARLRSVSEMERLVNGIITDNKLRAQIAVHQMARSHGATTLAESNQYRSAVGDMSSSSNSRSKAGPSSALFDVNSNELNMMPGAELLSRGEITLCATLRVVPHQYMILKDIMIRENAKTGYLRRNSVKGLIRFDSAKVLKIYDYLQACGWVKNGVPNNMSKMSSNGFNGTTLAGTKN